MNSRQYKYRLLNDKCWWCDEPLEKMDNKHCRKCPSCKREYSEVVLMHRKRKENI